MSGGMANCFGACALSTQEVLSGSATASRLADGAIVCATRTSSIGYGPWNSSDACLQTNEAFFTIFHPMPPFHHVSSSPEVRQLQNRYVAHD